LIPKISVAEMKAKGLQVVKIGGRSIMDCGHEADPSARGRTPETPA